MSNIYEQDFYVYLSEVDVNRDIRLSSLCNHFQNVAGAHSDILGTGLSALRQAGKMWVLTRVDIYVKKYPKCDQTMKIVTYPHAPALSNYDRDYEVYVDNELVITATSKWCIVSISQGKILKTAQTPYNLNEPFIEKRNMPSPLKIVPDENSKFNYVYTRTVRASDIDVNNHMNNVKYIDLAIDCYPIHKFINRKICNVSINYLRQAPEGAKIDMYLADCDNIKYIKGVIDNNEIFMVKVTRE